MKKGEKINAVRLQESNKEDAAVEVWKFSLRRPVLKRLKFR